MNNWKTIDSVPKDRSFLAYRNDGQICIAEYNDEFNRWMLSYDWIGPIKFKREYTHWMELPKSPKMDRYYRDQQLIEALADKVMGWSVETNPKTTEHSGHLGVFGRDSDGKLWPLGQHYIGNWNPLKKIEHAWMLIEKMQEENQEWFGGTIRIGCPGFGVNLKLDNEEIPGIASQSGSLAISSAIASAVGIKQ